MAGGSDVFLGTAVIGAGFLLFYLTNQKREKKDLVGRVSKIIIYPIKSCKGVEVDSCYLTNTGIQSDNLIDRNFMFVKSDGSFITQRTHTQLALIQIQVLPHGLKLEAPNMDNPLILPFTPAPDASKISVRLRTVHVMALDCGETAAKWAEEFLNLPGGRIVQADPVLTSRPAFAAPHLKKCNIRPQDYINFQDQSPVHIISTASIDQVNASLEEPVDERNFRPNILVSGADAPFDEDNWLKIFIRHTQMHGMWLDDRCKMTTIDPIAGKYRSDKQPLQALSKSRRMDGHISPCLGICAGTDVEGEFHVGDELFAVRGSIP